MIFTYTFDARVSCYIHTHPYAVNDGKKSTERGEKIASYRDSLCPLVCINLLLLCRSFVISAGGK